ncbi:MAG: hypothetical protein ACRDUY_04415 [Nitriliruptorales bacterium]
MDVLQPVADLFGGGLATPVVIVVGVVLLFAVFRVVSLALRLVILLVMAGLTVGAAPRIGDVLPWDRGQEVTGPAAECAVESASADVQGWEKVATKRISVTSLSDDARCAADGTLGAGSAEVVLRSLYDVPLGTRTVTAPTE